MHASKKWHTRHALLRICVLHVPASAFTFVNLSWILNLDALTAITCTMVQITREITIARADKRALLPV
jgi:hypothetical protein